MKLVLKDGILYESILVALDGDKVYAAPVGFVKKGGTIEVKIYKGTTLSNVASRHSRVSLNVTHDPLLFVLLAFKREFNVDETYLQKLVTLEKGIARLRECLGYIVASLQKVEDFGDYSVFIYRLESIGVCENPVVEPFTRCYSQLVEAAIYASKVKLAVDELLRVKGLQGFSHAYEVVKKTCSTDYVEVADRLRGFVGQWLER